jgi:hypothetical protein
MKKILLILALSASFCGAITNGVYATKDPYVVEAARMDYPRWLDSHLWLTAESPVLNEGATNAQWICYAKTCAGNATQAVVNSQPLRVLTNGVWVLRFDGTDDSLAVSSFGIAPPLTLVATFSHSTTNEARSLQYTLGDFSYWVGYSTGSGTIGAGVRNNTAGVWTHRAGVAYTPNITNIVTVALTFNGTNAATYVDGNLASGSFARGSQGSEATLRIGSNAGVANYLNGVVLQAFGFNRVLTTNEIWSISQ